MEISIVHPLTSENTTGCRWTTADSGPFVQLVARNMRSRMRLGNG